MIKEIKQKIKKSIFVCDFCEYESTVFLQKWDDLHSCYSCFLKLQSNYSENCEHKNLKLHFLTNEIKFICSKYKCDKLIQKFDIYTRNAFLELEKLSHKILEAFKELKDNEKK